VTKRNQMLDVLHFSTRLELRPDQKIVDKSVKGVCTALNHLTYTQIAEFLESLLNLEYRLGPEVSEQIIMELENRQKALL